MLHESLTSLSWLQGRWSTLYGKGSYPTMDDFSYHEDIEFTSVGQPMLNFTSQSRHPLTKTPMHREGGFLRIKPGTNHLAFVVSHNSGLASVEEGVYDPTLNEITLKSTSVSRCSFSKSPQVKSLERRLKLLDDGSLEVVLLMETERTELTEHLRAVYKKVE